MIATGVLLFLLGTKAAQSSAVHSDVKYEGPTKISIKETINKNPLDLPELGLPPYGVGIIHQGSNYFFGLPHFMPPPPVETVVPPYVEEVDEIITRPIVKTGGIIEKETTLVNSPVIDVHAIEEIPSPELHRISQPVNLPLPVDVHPLPPSLPVISNKHTIMAPELVVDLPKITPPVIVHAQPHPPVAVIPEQPLVEEAIPTCVEEESHTIPGKISIPYDESDYEIVKIPPPPELPPIDLKEILKPVIAERKNVVLVPEIPPIPTFTSPDYIFEEKNHEAVLCGQNIVFERILPNIVYEKGSTTEILTMPLTTRVPVVTSSVLPFLKK